MESIKELKKDYRNRIKNLKSGLINPNASLELGFGLIGSDKARLLKIIELLKDFKKDILFYQKINK